MVSRRVVLLAVAASLAAAAAGCGSSGSSTTTTKLTVDAKGPSLYVEDNPPSGSSVGDQRTVTRVLLFSNGKHAGRFDGTSTITARLGSGSKARESRLSTIQYTLAGGSIVTSGVYVAAPNELLPAGGVTRPIVGGTGKYRDAGGEVTQTALPNGEIHNVLEIDIPSS